MKKRVHYAILEDMQKYVKGFNLDDYIITNVWEENDSRLIEYLKEYYDQYLPVDLTAWVRVNIPNKDLIYCEAFREQICFVRDTLVEVLSSTPKKWKQHKPAVIAYHTSKSVKLPVYQITLEEGVEIVIRSNFYDWKISIKSKRPLDFDFMGLFNPNEKVPHYYCEGFPKNKVYGSYAENHSEFTIALESKYKVYVFMFLLRNYLGIKGK